MSPQATRIVVATVTLVTVIAACGLAVSRCNWSSRAGEGTELGFGVQELNKFSTEVAALLRSKKVLAGAGGPLSRRGGPQATLWAQSVDAEDSRRSLYEYSYDYNGDSYDSYEPEATATPVLHTPTPTATQETTEPPVTKPTPAPSATASPPSSTPAPTTAAPTPSQTTLPPGPSSTPPPVATTPLPVESPLQGVVYDGYIKGAEVVFQTSEGRSTVATTGKDGRFRFFLPKHVSGDLIAEPNGTDLFTGKPVAFRLALPFAEQVSTGGKYAISPFTTLAYFTRRRVPFTSDLLYTRVVSSLGLTLPEAPELASFDAISAVPVPGTPGRRTAVRNLLATSNIMSVVSTAAGLYTGICRIPKAEAGEWVFTALADAGPVIDAPLRLTDEQFVERDIMGSGALFDRCVAARAGNTRKRALLQDDSSDTPETIRLQLSSYAKKVAKAIVELNRLLEASVEDDAASTESVLLSVAKAGIVSQVMSETTEQLGDGSMSATEFEASTTGLKLKQDFDAVELSEDDIRAILESVVIVQETGEPIPRPALVDDPQKYSTAEIVGISVGPLLGVVSISAIVFLVFMIVKRRAGRKVESFNAGDAEAGLIDNEDGGRRSGSGDLAAASAGADESTYYTMPAPEPPRSPVRFPIKRDPLAPAAPRGSTEQQEMDIVSQAKKLEEERARADFDHIIKAQRLALETRGGPGLAASGAAEASEPTSAPEATEGQTAEDQAGKLEADRARADYDHIIKAQRLAMETQGSSDIQSSGAATTAEQPAEEQAPPPSPLPTPPPIIVAADEHQTSPEEEESAAQ